jgi:hypothetical protein
MTEDPKSLFVREGLLLAPTAAALGPWRPDALHGGSVSALLGQSLEEEGWQLARVTMDLLRRVPRQPLRLNLATTAGSRRVLRKHAELWAGDTLVAQANALLLPQSHLDLPPQPDRRLEMPAAQEPEEASALRSAIAERIGYTSFVSHAVETRNTRRGGTDGGSRIYWLKLLLPVISGDSITPIQRVAAAADYANGGFPSLPFSDWSFMSLDLTVQLIRSPDGEWIAVTSDSLASNMGIGLGDAELYDVNGRIGRAVATLLVEPR